MLKQKIPQKKIYFFEVGAQGRALIQKKYPQAHILAAPFNARTLPQVKDAEILCGFVNSEFSARNLRQLPQLKLVATRTAGYNHIDLNYTQKNQIPVVYVPDYGSHIIAEHTFALILASLRNLLPAMQRTRRLSFNRTGLCGLTLKEQILGVIGVGKIGSKVCHMAARGFGMKVLAFDLRPQPQLARKSGFIYVRKLDTIWQQAKIISLHTPLTPKTHHLINAQTIAKMQPGVSLINTARGELVDTHALLKALRSGKINGAALDVIEHEKTPKKDQALLQQKNVIVTPHLAFFTASALNKMYTQTFASLAAFQKNQPLKFQIPT